MADNPGHDFGLGPVDQISFAVHDLDAVLPTYTALYGPFTIYRVTSDPEAVRYRGEPLRATMRVGLARLGTLDIELVAVEEGVHPATDHIARHGEGIHHVGFHVADLDAKTAELEAAGFETILDGSTTYGARFRYFEAPNAFGHSVFELMQNPPKPDHSDKERAAR